MSLTSLFVYGTLKRGEINDVLLTPFARAVETGTISGLLYDVGTFPALVEGAETVHGEIVRVDPAHMARVLAVLDRLEGYDPKDESGSLYVRRVVEVAIGGDQTEEAYVYFYNPQSGLLPPLETLPAVESGEWRGTMGPSVAPGNASLQQFEAHVRAFRLHADEER